MTYSLKEYISAYIRIAGIFVPTRYIWRPFGELLEVDRCVADGGLVTDSQSSLSRHVGHSMRGPVKISLLEMIFVWIRIIK